MSEKYSNSFATTLNGAVNNTQTSVVVASASGAPAAGNFRIIVDAEIMLVTGVSGTTFTVTRGAEGTAATAHSSGAAVTGILTKGALDAIISDNRQYGAFASLPAAEKAGRVYRCSDSPYLFLDNGSSWQGLVRGWPATPVPTTGWSWDNQADATWTTVGGTAILTSQTSGNNLLRVRYRAKPTAPYTLTAGICLEPAASASFQACGVGFYDSSSGKLVVLTFGRLATGAMEAFAEKWTSASSFSAEYTHNAYLIGAPLPLYAQFAENPSGTFTLAYGFTPDNLLQIESVSATDFMASYDSVCVFVRQDGSTNAPQSLRLYSWDQS